MTAADFASLALADLGVSVPEQGNPGPLVRLAFNKLERHFEAATAAAREGERGACAAMLVAKAARLKDWLLAKSFDGADEAAEWRLRVEVLEAEAANIRARE